MHRPAPVGARRRQVKNSFRWPRTISANPPGLALSAQLMPKRAPAASIRRRRIPRTHRERAAGMQSLLTGVVDYWAIGAGRGSSPARTCKRSLTAHCSRSTSASAQRCAIVNCDPLPL